MSDQAPAPRANHVLIAGVSTRAAAESAARAGFTVTAIDAFGDLDQHPSVRALSLPRDFGSRVSAQAVARAARTIACDAVAYLSTFENHPGAVSMLAAGRALWGNDPTVLRRVRDPRLVTLTLRQRGWATPDVFGPPGVSTATLVSGIDASEEHTAPSFSRAVAEQAGPAEGQWLVKPLASGGGHRVRSWRRGARVPRGCYLQQLVDGTPGSVVFVAAAGRAVPLGMSRQLVGDPAFGADGYRYCGNILAAAGDAQFARDAALADAAAALACAVAEAFDLVGLNGVDFIARDGVPQVVEVNPRCSASMELVERAYGVSVFGAHASACASGALPVFDLARARRVARAYGKAILYARRDVRVGDTRAWLADATVRDVPHPGEHIRAGRPVCTVFAAGADGAACYAALVQRAARVYAELAAWDREVA